MSNNPRVHTIKRAQKEKLFLREMSRLLQQVSIEHKELQSIFVSRVELSTDKSTLFVFLYTAQGQEHFENCLEILKLYRPSMRASLAKAIKARYVPDIRFVFDERFEKQERFEELMERIKS
jgi:ribosome-binding factor A